MSLAVRLHRRRRQCGLQQTWRHMRRRWRCQTRSANSITEAAALSLGSASTFIELVADSFAVAEMNTCVEEDPVPICSAASVPHPLVHGQTSSGKTVTIRQDSHKKSTAPRSTRG